MNVVYVYEKHNGCSYNMITECNMETGDIESISMNHKDLLIITDRELSDIERFCVDHEDWDNLIGVFSSLGEFRSFLAERNLCENPFYNDWLVRYDEISNKDYQHGTIRKEDLKVGLFFFVDNNFAFSGCTLGAAENYGDFLVYPESHYDIWENYKYLNDDNTIPYDYNPRGRIVYRKSDDTFIIYYDKCVENELDRIARDYEGYNVKFELDEHYCCHNCNPYYVM